MPKFEEAVKLPDDTVLQLLTELETSQYYRADPRFLSNFLTPPIARRVLYALIIMNDQAKANFEPIPEQQSMGSSALQ